MSTLVQIDNRLLQSLHRIANQAMANTEDTGAMCEAMREVQSLIIAERIRIYAEHYPQRVVPASH